MYVAFSLFDRSRRGSSNVVKRMRDGERKYAGAPKGYRRLDEREEIRQLDSSRA